MKDFLKFLNDLSKGPWAATFFAVLTLVILWGIVISGYGINWIPEVHRKTAEITLPILAIIGAVALLASLAFLSSAFAAVGLADKRRALGLPEGSVRALIALLLLTFFVVTAIFLYRQSRAPIVDPEIAKYTGISEQQLAQIPSEQLITIQARTEGAAGAEEKIYDVTRRLPAIFANEASERFAQQILTAVSTLIASIASFYFGAQSVGAARGAAAPSQPLVRAITPREGKQGEELPNVEISGKNFLPPMTVKFVSGSNEMPFADVPATATKIILGKLTIPISQQEGTYDLIVVNADSREDRLPGAFEVKKKV